MGIIKSAFSLIGYGSAYFTAATVLISALSTYAVYRYCSSTPCGYDWTGDNVSDIVFQVDTVNDLLDVGLDFDSDGDVDFKIKIDLEQE